MSDIPAVDPPSATAVRSVREWIETNTDVAAAGELATTASYVMWPYSRAGVNRREVARFARAAEMLAQRHLATLIRAGQERGEIIHHAQRLGTADIPPPRRFAPDRVLSDAYRVHDGVSQERFDRVLTEVQWGITPNNRTAIVRALGWRSRYAKGATATKVEQMARQGRDSVEIAEALDITVQQVRRLAAKEGVTLADDLLARRRRTPNANRVTSTCVSTLEGVAQSLELVDVDDLSPELIEDWAASMRESLRTINQLLKEMTR